MSSSAFFRLAAAKMRGSLPWAAAGTVVAPPIAAHSSRSASLRVVDVIIILRSSLYLAKHSGAAPAGSMGGVLAHLPARGPGRRRHRPRSVRRARQKGAANGRLDAPASLL